MGFKAVKCSECGASLEVDESREFGFCSRCGTKFITEKVISKNITNVEKQVNVYFGENTFEVERKQCEVLIKCLEERDFHICKNLSLKILEQNPENQLANMVYKCNFEKVEEPDYNYQGIYFNFEPVEKYFKINKGSVSLEFSELMVELIKSSYPNRFRLQNCLDTIFENVECLICEKEEILEFYVSVKDFYLLDDTLEYLEEELSKTHGAGFKTFLFTGNEYLAAEMGEMRAELKKFTKDLTLYRDELFDIINEKYMNTKRISQEDRDKIKNREKELEKILSETEKQGCYIATSVYGSYDCPEVWCLRRYRDFKLGSTFFGRLFIKIYYTLSPTMVKWFGDKKWFKNFWKKKLDKKVSKLRELGYEDTKYEDKNWKNKN